MTTYKFKPYSEVKSDVAKLSTLYEGSNLQAEADKLLTSINDFCNKYAISCGYRLAVPQKAKSDKSFANAGIELGKIKAPKTLLTFLQNKAGEGKHTTSELIGMLLKHQKFNAKYSKGRLRVCFDTQITLK